MTRGKCVVDVLGAEARDQRQTPGLVVRIQDVDQLLQVLVRHARADLHGHRIRDAAEVLDVRAVQVRRAHADPRIVRRQVVPALPVRQEPRLRLLVRQLQPLVRREELDAMRFVHRLAADGLEELERIGHRLHELVVVRRERGLADEREVPVLGMMQIREPAVDQRAHEVQASARRARSRAASSVGSGSRSAAVNAGRLIVSPR